MRVQFHRRGGFISADDREYGGSGSTAPIVRSGRSAGAPPNRAHTSRGPTNGGVKPRTFAAGRASRPNPSANPVGGRGKKGPRPHVNRIEARRAAILRSLVCALAAAGIVLTGPAAANATPSPSSVEDQIDKQWNELE